MESLLKPKKTVQLLKDQTLGVGSYGSVCKANYYGLICAAKILHPTLFDPTAHLKATNKSRLPIKRFEQEIKLLSSIQHPNIIQYLGVDWDPDTSLPVLLMELMDTNLTNYLEGPLSIPHNTQVKFCHDISLALLFLHSNKIVHRDLSSNNILLISDVRAKVADFGIARFLDESHHSLTVCPGSDVYMPPEAVESKPAYCDKIDCFSFGVIILQMLTQEFPNPGDRHKQVYISDPHFPSGAVEIRCSEIERRQNHLNKVDPNNPLLSIILKCLSDQDYQRPSSLQLSEQFGILRRNEYASIKSQQHKSRVQVTVDACTMTWKKGGNAPCRMSRSNDAVVSENTAYFRSATSDLIYSYDNTGEGKWHQLYKCLNQSCSLAIVNRLLTAIGGCHKYQYSSKLFSFEDQKWIEMFPPMLTGRKWATTLNTDEVLIVAGGTGRGETVLSTVEVFKLESYQWVSVADLPFPMKFASAAFCGDHIFILSGSDKDGNPVKSVYMSPLSTLLSSHSTAFHVTDDREYVWTKAASLPVTCSTAVSFHNHLLALGGEDSTNILPSSAIHLYDPNSDSWEVIGHMSTARSSCLAAVLSENTLMVVGGITAEGWSALSSTELCQHLSLC